MSGLPKLPPGLPTGLAQYLTKLGEQFEVTQSDRGSPLNSKPTVQDLIDIGVITADANQALKVNGKTFSIAGAASWLASAVPKWFTSLLNPPAPSGLVVTANQSNLVLSWTPWVSEYYGQTLVYRATSNNLSAAAQIGSTTGSTYVDNLPPPGGAYYYWIRTESKSKNLSDFNAVLGSTVGNIADAPTISYVFDATDLVLSWPTPTSALQIKYYVIRYGANFTGGVDVGTSNTNTLRNYCTFGGTRVFWIAAVDINGQLGLAGTISVTVVNPNPPTALQTVQGPSLVLTYSATPGSLPVAGYELRYGSTWASGTTLAVGTGTRFETTVNWTGNRTFWVAAYDTAGNYGDPTQVVFAPTLPSAVSITPQVIDNNVLLSWTASTGTLPVASYQVDRGGTPVGVIAGRFTVVFESISGTYTYGVTPIDSAGNLGTRATVNATVAQPPDYVLYSDINSTFAGTKTNCAVDAASGGLLCNVDTSETWASHFTSRGWTSIADQVAAGYSSYVVGKTTGSYVETIDYGATIPGTKTTMTPTPLLTVGTVTIAPELSMGVDGVTFPQDFPSVYSAYAFSFRYVKYQMAFSATHTGTGLSTDTASLLLIKPLNYRLDVKQKTYQWMGTANSGDSGGTVVDITGQFIDVSSIVVAAQSTTPLFCVYDFVDVANPTQLKVLVFNSSGTRVTATVSVTIRGV